MPPKHRKPSGTGTSVEIGQEQLSNLQTQIDFTSEDTHNHVVTLADGIGTVAADLDETKADLTVVADVVTMVVADVDAVDSKVDGLATDLVVVDAKVDAVDQKVGNLEVSMNSIKLVG